MVVSSRRLLTEGSLRGRYGVPLESTTKEGSVMATRTARKRGNRWAAVAAAVAVGGMAAITGGAFADTIFVDGDSVAQPPNINIGGAGNRPCSDLGKSIAGAATVKYSGSNHFAAGETVDAVVNPDAAASAAGISTSAGTGVVPSPWDSSSPDFSVGFSTVVPAATPDGAYHVEVGAIGRSSQYDPPGRPQFVINVACGNTGGGGGGGGGGGSTDTTPPVIGYTLNPALPDGSNDWYRSDVTLTWTVTENESPSSLVKTGCVDQNITSDQLPVTYSCSATSDGGSAGPGNGTIKRDATAPHNNASAFPEPALVQPVRRSVRPRRERRRQLDAVLAALRGRDVHLLRPRAGQGRQSELRNPDLHRPVRQFVQRLPAADQLGRLEPVQARQHGAGQVPAHVRLDPDLERGREALRREGRQRSRSGRRRGDLDRGLDDRKPVPLRLDRAAVHLQPLDQARVHKPRQLHPCQLLAGNLDAEDRAGRRHLQVDQHPARQIARTRPNAKLGGAPPRRSPQPAS